MPLYRGSLGSMPVGFKAPSTAGAAMPGARGAADAATPSLAQRRQIAYPTAAGKTMDTMLAERLAKRSGIEYFEPETVTKKRAAEQAAAAAAKKKAEEEAAAAELRRVALATGGDAAAAAASAASATAAAAAAAAEAAAEEDEEAADVVDRLPESALGKIYFQVETDGATKHERIGIVIIDVRQNAVMMYDRAGRHHGNRPEPGYPLKEKEVLEARPGSTIKVGMKSVTLVTALREEAFRSGEFFLRSEHDQRKREEKKKARQAAIDAAAGLAPGGGPAKPKMTFGTSFGAFAAQVFRKRPRETGFIVPLAGRVGCGGGRGFNQELRALHDHDRPDAVVLFRADFKRDMNGRAIVSVVVDPVVGDKLRPHQRIGVKFLFDCVTGERVEGYHGAILADEMGLGKTIQTVATVWTCLKQGKYGTPVTRKAVIVAPSSLVKNWCNEFDKWIGPGMVKYFAISESTPKGDRILSRFDGEGDVLVISYDQLRKYVERISKMYGVDLVVCDEGHRLKNAEIKTTKAVDFLPTKRRIILSGTPIQNDLSEFHAMVGFVNPGILGNRDLFNRVFEEPIMRGRDPDCPEHEKELGAARAHYLATLTAKFILRRTQTINEKYLPAKVDLTVFINLGAEQRAVYQRVSALTEKLGSTPLVLITAMKKLCNHMDLFADAIREGNGLDKSMLPKGYKAGQLGESFGAKLEFVSIMLDQLRTNGDRDKLVIVSNYTQTLDIIAALCKTKNVSFFQLDGSTPIKRRQELVDRFNVPIAQEIVFLLSSKAGGVGLNLIGANRLILFDPDWNPANDAQAMGRVWRDGQKKKVFIYRLLSTGTIEEKVYQRQVSKQGLSANVVDMKDDSKQHFTSDELKQLFAYRPDTRCDTHDLLGCTCLAPARSEDPLASGKMQFRRVGVKAKETGGPRMDELKSWQHVAHAASFALDKVTVAIATRAPNLISFLFANERDAKKLEAGEITVDDAQPFVQDEGTITGGGGAGDDEELELEVHDSDSSDEDDDDE